LAGSNSAISSISKSQISQFLDWYTPMTVRFLLVLGAFALLFYLERRRPLRRAVEPALDRAERNLAMAGLAAAALQMTEQPITQRLTVLVERRRWGLLRAIMLPRGIEAVIALLLLDYTLYLWHVLTHRVPQLWRLHIVHHVDLDLDASTALRFHAAELLVSVLWRAAQILCLGITRSSLSLWQTFTLLSVLFHHSNVRLPIEFERNLVRFIVTPRMHGIHHSTVQEETASNWSSGLTIWDRFHGTLRLDVPQDAITIGVPAYRDPKELGFFHIVAMPFIPQRPAWRCPDGHVPAPRAYESAERFADPNNAGLTTKV
jgi:sterol desaturase/sphingolipid hydroxylase (fatty acid hydroxylase superfamily)